MWVMNTLSRWHGELVDCDFSKFAGFVQLKRRYGLEIYMNKVFCEYLIIFFYKFHYEKKI